MDGGVEVPFTRWELEEVWDPNPDAQGKMPLCCRRDAQKGFGAHFTKITIRSPPKIVSVRPLYYPPSPAPLFEGYD